MNKHMILADRISAWKPLLKSPKLVKHNNNILLTPSYKFQMIQSTRHPVNDGVHCISILKLSGNFSLASWHLEVKTARRSSKLVSSPEAPQIWKPPTGLLTICETGESFPNVHNDQLGFWRIMSFREAWVGWVKFGWFKVETISERH